MVITLGVVLFGTALAHAAQAGGVFVFLDEQTVQKGYTVRSKDRSIEMTFLPGILEKPSRVNIGTLDILPAVGAQQTLLSPVYSWGVLTEQNVRGDMAVKIAYRSATAPMRKMYARQSNTDIWISVPADWQSAPGFAVFKTTWLVGQVMVVGEAAESFSIRFDAPTVKKGYTVETGDNLFRFGILPDSISQELTIEVTPLPFDYAPWPQGLSLDSPVYHFRFFSDSGDDFSISKDLPIEIRFSDPENMKKIYYWDPQENRWYPSPSWSNYERGVVRTYTHQKEMIIAVFADQSKKEKGTASWYPTNLTRRNTMGAANNDYLDGTPVRVTNLENGKEVEVTIISVGPFVDGRIIDLTKKAFSIIANPSVGVIPVKVEPLFAP